MVSSLLSCRLTAFVTKCFVQSMKLKGGIVNVDPKIVTKSIQWMISRQLSSGVFPEPGVVFNKEMQVSQQTYAIYKEMQVCQQTYAIYKEMHISKTVLFTQKCKLVKLCYLCKLVKLCSLQQRNGVSYTLILFLLLSVLSGRFWKR